MTSEPSRFLRALVPALALVLVVAACGGVESSAAAGEKTAPDPNDGVEPVATTAAAAGSSGPRARVGVAEVAPGGAALYETPDGDPFMTAATGLVFGFDDRSRGKLKVLTNCNTEAWVDADSVVVTPRARRAEPGPGFDLGGATIVIDPGHGARDWGGVGPTGLTEKETNLDIAERVRSLMAQDRDIDWETGDVSTGSGYPAVANVILTRDTGAPDRGDVELGLAHRIHVANSAGADAFVSIHNNTVAHRDIDLPGTQVFYSVGAAGSDRLAAILYEELLLSFSAFEASWRGGDNGVRARIDPETEDDYYGLLRRAELPSAIVEGVYISEPEEEALLRTAEFRQAYAEGVYRGVVRFLTTSDTGAAINDPELFPDDAGVANTTECVIPEHE